MFSTTTTIKQEWRGQSARIYTSLLISREPHNAVQEKRSEGGKALIRTHLFQGLRVKEFDLRDAETIAIRKRLAGDF